MNIKFHKKREPINKKECHFESTAKIQVLTSEFQSAEICIAKITGAELYICLYRQLNYSKL